MGVMIPHTYALPPPPLLPSPTPHPHPHPHPDPLSPSTPVKEGVEEERGGGEYGVGREDGGGRKGGRVRRRKGG